MSESYDYDLPKRKRKAPKRYLDSEGDDDDALTPASTKLPRRKTTASKPRRKSSAAEAIEHDPDSDDNGQNMSVDVEGFDDEDDEFLAAASVGTSQNYSQSQDTKPRRKGSKAQDGPPARKKSKKMVVSDEEEDDYWANEVVPEDDDEAVEDDYYSEEENPKKARGKTSATGRGTKRKVKGDSDISSRPGLERKQSKTGRTSAALRAEESLQSLLDFGTNETVPTPDPSEKFSSPAADSPVPAPAPPLPKKLKLPTIKKNKLPGAANGSNSAGTSTPTSATAKTKLPLDLGIASKQTDTRKPTHNATADLDLMNKSIYQELFKTNTDGGTPRTGLNRRSKEEERRKELNKQREDYLAKQAQESVQSFDLQCATDKITQFEEKLRAIRSSALYPQWLGAKWRQIYEKENEKRRQREQAQTTSGVETLSRDAQEEGEVS